jgi:RNA polymerase sigma-70 factor (ECF subfamily)
MDAAREFDEVLRLAQAGDERAFVALYRTYHPRVAAYLRGRLGFTDEDVASDVWVSVAKAIRSFHGDESRFRLWLFTIASRRLVDRHRRWARTREDVVDPEHLVELPGADDPADAAVDGIATSDAVERLVRNLTPDQVDVILLRVLGGLEVAEVAHALGRTDNWVRVTQHRAVRRMAARLGPKAVTV